MTQPNLTEMVAKAISDELELTIWQDAEADPYGEIGGIKEAAAAAISAAREAIREEAFEEAAKVAEAKYADDRWAGHYRIAATTIAAEIRHLRAGLAASGEG